MSPGAIAAMSAGGAILVAGALYLRRPKPEQEQTTIEDLPPMEEELAMDVSPMEDEPASVADEPPASEQVIETDAETAEAPTGPNDPHMV